MSVKLNPLRWPAAWKSPSALALLEGSPLNCLVAEKGALPEPVAEEARKKGLAIADPAAPPPGVFIAKGEWPGMHVLQGDTVTARPTGEPWVDSNGWKVRLESARRPGSQIWVDAVPKGPVFPDSYLLALADSAAYGGRWLLSLDDRFAAALIEGTAAAMASWKKIAGAARFFEARESWCAYAPQAVVGIVSDFAGDNEFMGTELLNLVARTNQQYRILLKDNLSPASFANLRAVICADAAPPGPAAKDAVMAFVASGGLLITHPKWGPPPGLPAANQEDERYVRRTYGKGCLAIARSEFDDPWAIAQESVLLISHRYDLLRFWNSGSVGSYFTASPDRKRALIHLLFYADWSPGDSGVRVAGMYRSAKLWTPDGAGRGVTMVRQKNAVELQLPPMGHYGAVELEV